MLHSHQSQSRTHIAVTLPAVQVTYFQLGVSHGHVWSFHDAWISLGHLQQGSEAGQSVNICSSPNWHGLLEARHSCHPVCLPVHCIP